MLNHKHWFAGAASCIIDECGADPNDVYEAMRAAPPLNIEALAEEIERKGLLFSGCGCGGDHCPCSGARDRLLAILQRATGRK